MPIIIDLIISNLQAYDFPAPALAKTTELAFSKEKRSKITKVLLWRLTP